MELTNKWKTSSKEILKNLMSFWNSLLFLKSVEKIKKHRLSPVLFSTQEFFQIFSSFKFFNYPPSSAIASCVGTAAMVMWRLHLTKPCCVALGWVLIWVMSPDWLIKFAKFTTLVGRFAYTFVRSFVNFVSSFPDRDKLFLILSDRYHVFLRQREYSRTTIIAVAIATI